MSTGARNCVSAFAYLGRVSTVPRVLLVEDDPETGQAVALLLSLLPSSVDLETDGAVALDRVRHTSYDAIVMDLSLPRMDGLALCQALRQQQQFMPILMLTARASEADRVVGLEVGADDYLTKPFGIRELQARLRALLRRRAIYSAAAPDAPSSLAFGDLALDLDRRVVSRRGSPIALTAKEFDLLSCLARHPGRVYSREQLLDAVWGYTHGGYGNTVNSHINRLRAKIERDPADPEYVLTVWSVGYKFSEHAPGD